MPNEQKQPHRKIAEMRNLGPACERDLNAAGIFTSDELIALGPEGAFLQMMQQRLREGRSAKCCNAAYLYALHGAIHDIDWRALPEAKKNDYKEFTAQLRQSGRFS